MTRPAFQFYTGDWQKNAKLRRCSHAARGAWIDVLCLFHDSEEYGVLRWPLKDIAQAAGVPMALIRELVTKDVLKGADSDAEPYIFRPKHAGREGDPVTLVVPGGGPCWYSSRFVRDEWVRQRRGGSTQFTTDNQPPKVTPMVRVGDRQGDGPSSSSSTSVNPSDANASVSGSRRFDEFWAAWPKSNRKVDKAKCLKLWGKQGLDSIADVIIAHVEAMKSSVPWTTGFDPAPLTYLNGKRWLDPLPDAGYSESQAAVMKQYNEILSDQGWPEAVVNPHSPERAAAIDTFLTLGAKPDWVGIYFRWMRDNVPAKPGYGFDWILRRETFIRAREGNFTALREAA